MRQLEKLQSKTRWNLIPGTTNQYRLLCSHPECSLSCANLRSGKLSVTSIHGADRHSYLLTKNDMAFVTIDFLGSLTPEELNGFCKLFNQITKGSALTAEKT